LERIVPASLPRAARRLRLPSGLHLEGIIAVACVAAAWQVASHFFPAFLFPSLQTIGSTLLALLQDRDMLATIGLTFIRILVALFVTFVLGTALGILAALHVRAERVLVPLIQLKQGVPGVCWVIFAILWFQGMETRIAFIVIISTLPSFFYQARDGVRAISQDLWAMVRAWRPSRAQMLSKLILPALKPTLLTAWRINLGGATRMVITAELLAGISCVPRRSSFGWTVPSRGRWCSWSSCWSLIKCSPRSSGTSCTERALLRVPHERSLCGAPGDSL
jgi:ABC-type nitrate/sulfonate/bicarbonate transport system permease component